MCVTYYYVVSSLRQVFAQPESHSQYVLAKKYQAPVMTDDFNKAVLSCRCEKNRCRIVWRFRDINSRHRHLSKTAIATLVLSILAACVSDVRSYIRWMFFQCRMYARGDVDRSSGCSRTAQPSGQPFVTRCTGWPGRRCPPPPPPPSFPNTNCMIDGDLNSDQKISELLRYAPP